MKKDFNFGQVILRRIAWLLWEGKPPPLTLVWYLSNWVLIRQKINVFHMGVTQKRMQINKSYSLGKGST